MSRKRKAPQRVIYQDPKYESLILSKFINFVMYDGKKGAAQKIIYNALDEIKNKTNSRAFSYDKAQFMSDGERTISFLNRYFIYKKVRKVSNTEKVSLDLQDKTEVDVDVDANANDNDVTLPSEEHLRPKNLVKRKG